jgi:hypothetical protein
MQSTFGLLYYGINYTFDSVSEHWRNYKELFYN